MYFRVFNCTMRVISIYIKNSKGPNTEDWDTPYLMSEKLELNPLIDANNFILLL